MPRRPQPGSYVMSPSCFHDEQHCQDKWNTVTQTTSMSPVDLGHCGTVSKAGGQWSRPRPGFWSQLPHPFLPSTGRAGGPPEPALVCRGGERDLGTLWGVRRKSDQPITWLKLSPIFRRFFGQSAAAALLKIQRLGVSLLGL